MGLIIMEAVMRDDAKEDTSLDNTGMARTNAFDSSDQITRLERERPMGDWILEAREALSRDMAAVAPHPSTPPSHRASELAFVQEDDLQDATDVQARPKFDMNWTAEGATAAYSRAVIEDAIVEETVDGPVLRVDDAFDDFEEDMEAGVATTAFARPATSSGAANRALQLQSTSTTSLGEPEFEPPVASPGPAIDVLQAPAPKPVTSTVRPVASQPALARRHLLTPIILALGMALLMAAVLRWVL